MDTIGKPVAQPARNPLSIAVSSTLHALVLTVLLYHSRHFIAPVRYPGTEHGHNLVLSYLPGRAPTPSVAPPPKAQPLEIKSKLALKQPDQTTPTQTPPAVPTPSAPATSASLWQSTPHAPGPTSVGCPAERGPTSSSTSPSMRMAASPTSSWSKASNKQSTTL